MALELNPGHTALLVMDFENDIVHEEGAFKDFGFAQMVKDNDVLGKTARLLTAARNAGILTIYVSVKFRPGYPERPANAGLWQGLHAANALIEGTWGAAIHDALPPPRMANPSSPSEGYRPSPLPTWSRYSKTSGLAHCCWPV